MRAVTPYRSRARGDCRAARGHRTNEILLNNRNTAQVICDLVCDYLKIPRHTVVLRYRKTKNLRGKYFSGSKVIWLYYPRGMMVGTLLHEIAHYDVRGHSPDYKYAHARVLLAYDRLYPPTPIQTVVSAIDELSNTGR